MRRPDEPGDFWRRAWVNAVTLSRPIFPQAFRISQDRGEGMIIHGGRQWRDYRVETALTVHLAEYAGVGVRVQGLRRYYAALLVRPDMLRLVRVRDGATTVLAEASFAWSFERPYARSSSRLRARNRGSVDGVRLRRGTRARRRLPDGGVALIIEGGAASTDEVVIAPVHHSPTRVEASAKELAG